ncbi:MAG: 3-phosphoshikimate 1-carboxyvinyltransferase [Clostridia bacterium]|nr:3-phosphoshikimate 1-carboxyvinyltransferase [Clostridia bacterium]
MKAVFSPSTPRGSVEAPPSKSAAHRRLICAGLADGVSFLSGIAPSEDIAATVDCLCSLGAKIDFTGNAATVLGCDPRKATSATLPCRESGSTLRFFLPLCLLSGNPFTLSGSEKLLSRPLSVYEELASEKGFLLKKEKSAVSVAGRLTPGTYTLPGDVSSQFVTGLLFALPLLDGDSTIVLTPPVESRGYIDMTLAALAEHGVRAAWQNETTLAVPGGQTYLPRAGKIEGDWSNAAPFLSLGVAVTGLDPASLQGDRRVVGFLSALDRGCAEIDLSDTPDLAPVLFAHAALRDGGRFTGTKRLALKESDRGRAMQEELAKCGVAVAIGENEITVAGGAVAPREPFAGHNDHRIVMATSILAARLGGTVEGIGAVNKSFPDFFQKLKQINIKVEIKDGMDIEK